MSLTTAPTRALVRSAARLAHAWQCMSCGSWFSSDTPSQLCSSCGG
ncbi:hypothetical protein [Streptomyces sp. NPDC053720]